MISDEDAWDSTVYAISKLWRNSPFNPMSWMRTWGYWVMKEGERPDAWDWTAKAVWAAPAPMAAILYPEYSFGFIRSAMAITADVSIPAVTIGAVPSPNFLAPTLAMAVLRPWQSRIQGSPEVM